MTAMRERMAMAIYGLKTPIETWSDAGEITREKYFVAADAVLDELMRPSDAMMAAFCNEFNCGDDDDIFNGVALRMAFAAAIRTAKEGK